MDECFVWWNDVTSYRRLINTKITYHQPLRCVFEPALLTKQQIYFINHRYRRFIVRYQTHRRFRQYGPRFNTEWYILYSLLFRYTNTRAIVPTETNRNIFGHG